MQEIRISNPPVVIGICGPNKSQVQHRAWRTENLGARFFMYANTGLHAGCARCQFRARDLPVLVRRLCMPPCTWLCTLCKYFPSDALSYPYTTLKYVIPVNITNNENLDCFSSLTTGKVSRLTICFETVKLMKYGINEIDRDLFEIRAGHFESSILFKIMVKRAD